MAVVVVVLICFVAIYFATRKSDSAAGTPGNKPPKDESSLDSESSEGSFLSEEESFSVTEGSSYSGGSSFSGSYTSESVSYS